MCWSVSGLPLGRTQIFVSLAVIKGLKESQGGRFIKTLARLEEGWVQTGQQSPGPDVSSDVPTSILVRTQCTHVCTI